MFIVDYFFLYLPPGDSNAMFWAVIGSNITTSCFRDLLNLCLEDWKDLSYLKNMIYFF